MYRIGSSKISSSISLKSEFYRFQKMLMIKFICFVYIRKRVQKITFQQILHVYLIYNFSTNKTIHNIRWKQRRCSWFLYGKWVSSVICHVSIVWDLVSLPKCMILHNNRLFIERKKNVTWKNVCSTCKWVTGFVLSGQTNDLKEKWKMIYQKRGKKIRTRKH